MTKTFEASRPIMDLVGGPQASGKSTLFPVSERGNDWFNIDEERKRLNGGASQNIPSAVQRAATAAYEQFIVSHIGSRKSFSIEVTLAREVTFEQARRAREAGFKLSLTYLAAELPECVERMAARVEEGGHGVQVKVLKATHAASVKNLRRAIQEFDYVEVFDNSRHAEVGTPAQSWEPRLVLQAEGGVIRFKAKKLPSWLRKALGGRG